MLVSHHSHFAHRGLAPALTFSNPKGWDVVKGKRLERAARHFQGVKVTREDCQSLFNEPGEGVWIYADPPYIRDGEPQSTSRLYQLGFTRDDHRRLADTVKGCGHKVALSYGDNEWAPAARASATV